jgi:molybdenum cofactor biosynthesis enzyme MoaA
MRIATMSVVVGGTGCNARCPFCIARMTPNPGVPAEAPAPKWANLGAAIRLAEQCGVTTYLLTGKGEPTLFKEQVTAVLRKLARSRVPFRELQTNAIAIGRKPEAFVPALRAWRRAGLNTIAISIVSPDDRRNEELLTPGRRYPPLGATVRLLVSQGFTVRLSCIMLRGYVDRPQEIEALLAFARKNGAAQVTIVPLTRPSRAQDPEAHAWASEHGVEDRVAGIREWLDRDAQRLLVLPHGAVIYDYRGQNLCLSNCLTETTDPERMRQLIYFPHDGSLRFSWQHEGARLL